MLIALLFVRRARKARGWLTPVMERTRLLYPVIDARKRLRYASDQDGAVAEESAALVRDWGGILFASHGDLGYAAVVTKNGWIAVASDGHSTVDAAVADAIEQLDGVD